MSRPVVLGNGSMMVGLDRYGLVHDFYYPFVGLENHTNARGMHHRIGVRVGDTFSWLEDEGWEIELDYEPNVMISNIRAHNAELGLALEFHDFVDSEYNAWCRNVEVQNRTDQERSVQVFFHQVLKISDSNRGDTALYVPEEHYILDYKGRRSFIIYGQQSSGEPFDQYSIGLHGIEGKEGTFRDAEDGELSNHPVEHGSVDSTIRFGLNLPAQGASRIHYWIIAAASHADAHKIHRTFLDSGFSSRHEHTSDYWQNWLSTAKPAVDKLPERLKAPFTKSLLIMKSHIDRRGSILASGDSEMLNYARDNYSYCWPRDAAYILWPMIRLGYTEEAKSFFEFARDVLNEDGALMHKFQPDRAVGSTWHPLVHKGKPELAIQEDETAIVLFMMNEYLEASDDEDFVRRFYSTFIQPAANFLESFIDNRTKLPHASYDLWEEKFLTTTYTTAVTYAGLGAAAAMAERFEYPDDSIRWQAVATDIQAAALKRFYNPAKQYFYKGYLLDEKTGEAIYDDTIDTSSLYGAVTFGLWPSGRSEVSQSLATLETQLLNSSPSGGLPRYEGDTYCAHEHIYKGNPWFVTTLWLAQLYQELNQRDKIDSLIDWTLTHIQSSGALSEQVDQHTSEPRSVSPLCWSQAELIVTALNVYVQMEEL